MVEIPVVLIVDDAPANIQVLAACLKEHYQIKVATAGDRCLELACADPVPDLILLDIEMPGMDGYEVCRRLKSNPDTGSIPVIFVTGKEGEQDEEYGLELGAVDYITKPIRPAIVLARVRTQMTLQQQLKKLEEMALYDQLTGLYNRHYLLEAADQKVAHAVRHEFPLSLLMLDIDYFKAINDEHGHPKGDAVLKVVAQVLGERSRQEDIPARYGGEEFIILLEQCDSFSAEAKAQVLRQRIEALQPEGISVTVSIGVTQLGSSEDDFESMLQRVDQALYRAKEQGRNCVVVG